MQLVCDVQVIDMEARADGRALKTLLPHLNPRKLVLVGAEKGDTEDLAEACSASATTDTEVLQPNVNDTLQVGEDIKMFSFKLDDDMLSSVVLRKVSLLSDVFALDGF